MTCGDVEERELVERFVAGTLDEHDRDAFEEHILGCDTCFDRVQTTRMLRHELGSPKAAAPRNWPLIAGLAVAAVLALAVAATLRSGRSTSSAGSALEGANARQASSPATPASSPLPTRAQAIMQLAQVEPPRFLPPNLRGADDDRRRAFLQAMEKYRASDYESAASALRALATSADAAAETLFYLAVCDLAGGRAADAARGFSRVIELKDFVLEEDAHFFLAKAHLSRGDVESARKEFEQVVALKGDREGEARAILSALAALPTR